MEKMLLVYNPKSGKGQIRFSLSRIIEIFSEADYDVTVYPTKAARDATLITCERADSYDMIVCSGGDGTLDEVVTGLMESGIRRPIGYIPAGSTNDFASSIGIPRQLERAADTIVNGNVFHCDLGRFNLQNYFVYVAAFGLLTDVSYQTKQEMKNVFGHAAYIIEGVKRLGSWRSYALQIESEEFSGSGEFIYGMVTNAHSVGGIKGLPGKDVELDDGLFEVMLVRTPIDLSDWQKTLSALVMNEESNENVIRFKTSRLTVRSDEPLAWTRDGEDGGEHLCVELENLPRVLDIMIGEQPETIEPQPIEPQPKETKALKESAETRSGDGLDSAETEGAAESQPNGDQEAQSKDNLDLAEKEGEVAEQQPDDLKAQEESEEARSKDGLNPTEAEDAAESQPNEAEKEIRRLLMALVGNVRVLRTL